MEDLETSATLEFHGVRYVVTLQVQQQFLHLQVETSSSSSSPSIWTGSFPATDIEQLTRQTGNWKRFPVFVQMLLTALRRKSDAVFVDLLTAADLDLYRQRKLQPGLTTTTDGLTGSPGKRYLILTYAVEFDRVHYPLPLAPVLSPSPEILQRTIRRLRQTLEAAENNTSQGGNAGNSHLTQENAALREENRCLKNTLKQYCDGTREGDEVINSTAELQRELQTSIEENKELITLYQQFREDSAEETAQLRAEIKQLRFSSQQNEHTELAKQEQERLEAKRKIKDSNAALQESLAQMLQMKAQLEELQLKNRELLRQLAIARAHAGQQQGPHQRQPHNTNRNGDSSSRFSAARSPSARQNPPLRAGITRQQQVDTVFLAPFRSSSSHYGASDDEDAGEGMRNVRRGRPTTRPSTRPTFRRFDPTAYQQEKERKLRAARARSNSRTRPPRSNGGYTSDSSAGGYSSTDSRGSKTSSHSTRSHSSRLSRERQRIADARLSSPKRVTEPPPVENRRPRAANNAPLPRSGPPRSRSQSRGRSPSPSPSLNHGKDGVATAKKPAVLSPRTTSPVVNKIPQQKTVTKRRKQPPQALLDTSTDSFSDIDDRLTALQQFLREAKQGGVAAAGASTSTAA